MAKRINRREGLAQIGAVLAASLPLGTASARNDETSLNTVALGKGRRFGSCIAAGNATGGTVDNKEYAGIVSAECGIVVPENEMKWQALRPALDRYDFERADRIAAWCKRTGMAMRGHTLLWHRPKWMPGWVNTHDFGARPASNAEALIVEHIRSVTSRYGEIVKSWDVVNEAVNDAADGYEETSLSRAIGSVEQTLDIAFHAARAQAPTAQLVYNDYMSLEPGFAGHRALVLRLLEGFRKRGTPVDALGIQSHIAAVPLAPDGERAWRSFIDEVAAMGYRILITEFDVREKGLPADIILRDKMVSDYARRYLDLMLSYRQVGDVLAWGMMDCHSWLQGFAPRNDGLEVRGCPYGSDGKPKALRTAIAASFAGAKQAI